MQPSKRSWILAAGILLSFSALARADLIEQFVVPPRDCTPCVWFQAFNSSGATASLGHSGVLNLGSMSVGSTLHGGWLTFTPQGTFLHYMGGGSAHEILSPSGGTLANVRGALKLGEAYGVIVDTSSGSIVGVTLYAGALLWTPTKTYLLLVGGIPTTYEFTLGGASIAGVRGGTLLDGNVIDMDPGLGVSATLFSGAAVYTGTQVLQLTTFGLGIGATELTLGASSISSVRGMTVMGAGASPLGLDATMFLWTPTKTLLYTTSSGVSEVLDPLGAPLARTWGVTRQSPLGAGGSLGVATVINVVKEHLVVLSGGALVSEVLRPSGGSLTSNVVIPAGSPLLHQASGLSEIYANWSRTGFTPVQGTVIGSLQ